MSTYEDYKKFFANGGYLNRPALTLPSAKGGSGSGGNGETGQSPLEWGIDIISRPLYAVQGALTKRAEQVGSRAVKAMDEVRSGKRDGEQFLKDAAFGTALSEPSDVLGMLEAAWKGFTSTDPADKKTGVDLIDEMGTQIAGISNDTYTPPTLDDVKSIDDTGNILAAVGRGAGGFALDVGLDPLTYGTLGVGKLAGLGMRGAKAAIDSGRASRAAAKAEKAVAENAPSAVARAAESAPAEDASRLVSGAANVADPMPQSVMRTILDGSTPAAASFDRVTNAAARTGSSLPKVSETISSTSGNIVEALLRTGRELDEAMSAATPKAAAAPKATRAARSASTPVGGPANLGDFARQFFGESDEVLGQMRAASGGPASNIFPSNVIKGLSGANRQAVETYWKRLTASVRANPKGASPQLIEFLSAASRWAQDQKAARQATGAAPTTRPATEVVEEAIDTAPTAARADVLRSILRKKDGKPTDLGKQLRSAVGDKLFRQISGVKAAPEVRERVLDELLQIARNADEVSPTTFDGMHENVRHFVEDTLQLRREDFDLAVRQKVLDHELYAAQPKVYDKATAAGVDPDEFANASALTGLSRKQLQNHYEAKAREIAGDAFDPKKGHWTGNAYHFSDGAGNDYVILNGQISTHAFTSRVIGAVNEIDKAVPLDSSGFYANKRHPTSGNTLNPRALTAARRAELPRVMREIDAPFFSQGIRMGVKVDGEFVDFAPSNLYDAVDDFATAARQTGGDDAERAVRRLSDIVLYNPGTSAPYTNLFEAVAASMRGASDEALDKILKKVTGKYTGKEYANRTQLSSKGGQYNREVFTADKLRALTLNYIREITPYVRSQVEGMNLNYGKKSITDAGAINSTLGARLTEAAARGDGEVAYTLGGIENDIMSLARDYGASGHAVGIAAETLARDLPPWAVKRAKGIKSTQTAYVNATRAGKTANEQRVMGAVSEAKRTPVDVNAAIDDAARLMDDVSRTAAEGDELYELGTDAVSKLDTQIRSSFGQMVHGFRKRFSTEYGASADGVSMTQAGRSAIGSAAKSIYYRQNDINRWANKYNTTRIGDTKETIGSAAWKLLQQGVDEIPPQSAASLASSSERAAIAQALEELKPLAGYFFDINRRGFDGDMYWRSGSQNLRYLDYAMNQSGFTKKYGNPFDEALLKNAAEGKTAWWREVDVENPAEFLSLYNQAVHSAMGQRASTLILIEELKRAGLMSTKAVNGFKKPSLAGDSFFFPGLQEAGVYVDPRVLDAMSEVDRMLTAARSFGDTNLISTMFDPAMSAWKMGMTIMRPGHHVRNMLSNAMLSYMDQGGRNLAKSGWVAAKILARRQGDTGLAGISELERILNGAGSALKSGGDEVVQTTKLPGGKTVELTMDGLHDAFSVRGGLRTFQQAEDILRGKGRVQRAADLSMGQTGPLKGIGKAASAVSEATDHHGYLQQFIQIVMNNTSKIGKQYKTLDDLYDYAIRRAHKFHPDSTSITAFEAKYLRRLIPFYNWFRATLPVIVETSAKYPGRAAVAHKASFNIAQTFGIDAESFSNPWPEDSEVPDYIRDGVFGANALFGDQMFTLNPGFAHTEIAQDFFGRGPEEGGNFVTATMTNAGRSLIGMMNPFLKAPMELTSGVRSDGRKIYSAGDYFDESLPFINYLTSRTGVSFADNVVNPIGAIAQGRPHERSQVDRGYQPSIFEEGIGEHQTIGVLNWLLGQGAQPVNTAAQEAEKEALRDARLAARESGGDVGAATEAISSAYQAAGSGSGGAGASWVAGNGSGGGDSSLEGLLGGLNIPRGVQMQAPAQLDLGSVQAIESLLQGSGKPLTASQRMSMAEKLQQEALRQQSATNWPGYAAQNLQQLAAQNPHLSVSELLQLAKHLWPNPYDQ